MAAINKEYLEKFKQYLDKQAIPYRDGKGDYQWLQVCINGKWDVLYLSKSTPNHANAKTEPMTQVVKSFLTTL